MTINRRQIIGTGLATAIAAGSAIASGPGLAAAPGQQPALPFTPGAGKRSRLIYLNDLSGDIDGLFATVHAILSPSTELKGIVGTDAGRPKETTERSVALGREILALMGRAGTIPVLAGAPTKLQRASTPIASSGTDLIISEALRTDTKSPLYLAVGGGLTEVASALMLEPRIADKLILIWIGGDAYPAGGTGEYNFNIDPLAAQFVYNDTNVRIWQVPRSVYRTCVVSASELQVHVAPRGAIGEWLYQKVVAAPAVYKNYMNMGETWTLGDSPLVVLSALADWLPSGYSPQRYEYTGSSQFDEVVAPHLNGDGTFTVRTDGRKIRIYNTVDNRLMFGDFFAKLQLHFPNR